jgi:hypothetical protein
MKRMKNIRLGTLVACMCVLWGCEKPNVNIVMPQEASNRVLFAGEHLKKALEDAGYSSVMLSDTAGMDKDEVCIRLEQTNTPHLPALSSNVLLQTAPGSTPPAASQYSHWVSRTPITRTYMRQVFLA